VTVSALPHDRFQQPARSRYRPEIDGMRAVAVIAVIVNHFNKELLPSGFLGVDIFFVISGYVITASLVERARFLWKAGQASRASFDCLCLADQHHDGHGESQ
jgi:peptidoglycan/LPS O-acetylase OafA/YrhL